MILTHLLQTELIDGATASPVIEPPPEPPSPPPGGAAGADGGAIGGNAVGFGGFNVKLELEKSRTELVAGVVALREIGQFFERR
jgi:hypothetical protein